MPKKLATGARKRVMAGKRSATKRELVEAGRSRPAGGRRTTNRSRRKDRS